MYERFTDRARKVMQLANQEAQRLGHEYIGTEHILLGVCKEGSGTAAAVLENIGVDLCKVKLDTDAIIQAGPDMAAGGKLPQTPRAKKVIEFAMSEARALSHNYVGTEHLLLGLCKEGDGVASQVLTGLGATHAAVLKSLLELHPAENEKTDWSAIAGSLHEFETICAALKSGAKTMSGTVVEMIKESRRLNSAREAAIQMADDCINGQESPNDLQLRSTIDLLYRLGIPIEVQGEAMKSTIRRWNHVFQRVENAKEITDPIYAIYRRGLFVGEKCIDAWEVRQVVSAAGFEEWLKAREMENSLDIEAVASQSGARGREFLWAIRTRLEREKEAEVKEGSAA